MAQSYKTLKENFVSGLSGGSVWEVNCVTAIAPAAYLLWSVLQARHGLFLQYGLPAFFADAALNVAAILLAITLYASISVTFNALLLATAGLLYLSPSVSGQQKKLSKPPTKPATTSSKDGSMSALPNRPFITAYRGGMMIVTCLAILAVDFKVFPRRFAKVETWGTSLMDMGVGSFVFSAGLVSARSAIQAELSEKTSSLYASLRASIKASLPLLFLGLVRLYSVKGLDYAEHVTEYGIHWNFFFTLAFLPPFVALCQPLPKTLRCYVLPPLIGIAYQTVLNGTNLKAYMLTAPRVDFISQNREGIFSFWGYLVIFLSGQAVGFDILPRNSDLSESTESAAQKRFQLLKRLGYWWASSFAQYLFSTSRTSRYVLGLGMQPSRRLANLPYAEWVIWFNCAQLFAYCVVESALFPGVYAATEKASEQKQTAKATSGVLKAFNRNGLAIFLLANLLTGLVNMTMDTLTMDRLSAMTVLGIYAVVLTSIAVDMDRRNISIKL